MFDPGFGQIDLEHAYFVVRAADTGISYRNFVKLFESVDQTQSYQINKCEFILLFDIIKQVEAKGTFDCNFWTRQAMKLQSECQQPSHSPGVATSATEASPALNLDTDEGDMAGSSEEAMKLKLRNLKDLKERLELQIQQVKSAETSTKQMIDELNSRVESDMEGRVKFDEQAIKGAGVVPEKGKSCSTIQAAKVSFGDPSLRDTNKLVV